MIHLWSYCPVGWIAVQLVPAQLASAMESIPFFSGMKSVGSVVVVVDFILPTWRTEESTAATECRPAPKRLLFCAPRLPLPVAGCTGGACGICYFGDDAAFIRGVQSVNCPYKAPTSATASAAAPSTAASTAAVSGVVAGVAPVVWGGTTTGYSTLSEHVALSTPSERCHLWGGEAAVYVGDINAIVRYGTVVLRFRLVPTARGPWSLSVALTFIRWRY
jgi:hypothetical protein